MTAIQNYQAQGFVAARAKKGMDYQRALMDAGAAVVRARENTPLDLRHAFEDYRRFVAGPNGGYEWGWVLR